MPDLLLWRRGQTPSRRGLGVFHLFCWQRGVGDYSGNRTARDVFDIFSPLKNVRLTLPVLDNNKTTIYWLGVQSSPKSYQTFVDSVFCLVCWADSQLLAIPRFQTTQLRHLSSWDTWNPFPICLSPLLYKVLWGLHIVCAKDPVYPIFRVIFHTFS